MTVMTREAALARLEAFDAELKAAAQQAKDAARYRWWRHFAVDVGQKVPADLHFAETPEAIDAAIDAAMAKEQ